MNDDTRTAVLNALWAAVRALVPTQRRADVPRLILALERTYDDYGDARHDAGFSAGLKQGLMSIEAREDRRDLLDVQDAPELRSVH